MGAGANPERADYLHHLKPDRRYRSAEAPSKLSKEGFSCTVSSHHLEGAK